MRDLEQTREKLDQFRSKDLPKFARWLNSHFGALITELRETTRKLQEKEYMLLQIGRDVFFQGMPPDEAYTRATRNPEEAAKDEDEHSGPRSRESENREFEPDDFEEDEFDFGFGGNDPRFGASKPSARGEVGARLKELYRALVKRLHPDAQEQMTHQKLEWWHEVQMAYQAGDVAKLEVILTLCESEDQGTLLKTSVSVLQSITAEFKKSLRRLKSELGQFRRDPAWNFSERTDTDSMIPKMRRELEHDLELIKKKLQSVEMELASWADLAHPKKGKGKARRRRRSFDPMEFFMF